MSQGWKTTVIVLAVVGIASTPLVWLLNSPGSGEMVGASVQAAVGVVALVWAVFQDPGRRGSAKDKAVRTGEAEGGANTGIIRPGGRGGGSAEVKRTGKARGKGSNAGIDYSK
ncbi:hypothetical protein [Streptomyces sp. NPDC003688]